MDPTTEALLTVAGNAALVALVLHLLVKPFLNEGAPYYQGWLNVAAVVVGMVGALAAQAIPGIDYAGALQAVLIGLSGAAAALGIDRFVGNTRQAVKAYRE